MASLEPAIALHVALGGEGGLAFLDSSDIAAGDRIPPAIFDALLGARVVVVFAEPVYFTRRYCVQEFRTAFWAYDVLASRGTPASERDAAARCVVVALPSGAQPREISRLPPPAASTNWPGAGETERLVELVRARLAGSGPTIGDSLRDQGELDRLRSQLELAMDIPEPQLLRGIVVYHQRGLAASIGDAFVGRGPELWQLHTLLSTSGRGGAVAALTGSVEGGGGFGKTRLALEYLHRYGPQNYPGGLFWIDAEATADRIEAQLHGVLSELKPGIPDLLAFRRSRRNVGRELAVALRELPPERPALYVVDNVPEPEAGQPPLPLDTWCPAIGQVALLLTSRFRYSLRPDVQQVQVGELADADAVALLTHRYAQRSSATFEMWLEAAAWVGHLALALELLNAALRAGVLSPDELIDIARSSEGPVGVLERQMDALRSQVPAEALVGVAEAFELSYRRLPAEAQTAARLLAMLSPDAVPFAVLEALGDERLPGRARADLASRSFVVPVAGSTVPMFGRMHRVLADFLRSKSADLATELSAVMAALVHIMHPERCKDPAAWPLLDSCRPHAEAVVGRAAEMAWPEDAAISLVRLLHSMGILLDAQGRQVAAREALQRTVDVATRVLGAEHRDTLAAMGNLALTVRDLGLFDEARALQQRVLAADERHQGDGHPSTLIALGNLALTVDMTGDLRTARRMQERVVDGLRRALGEEAPVTLRAMGSLARTLADLGELEPARELQERVLEVWRRLDADHVDAVWAMGALARTLRALGELGRARELVELVVDERQRRLGEDHPDTLDALTTLSQLLHDMGDRAGARRLAERVLELSRKRFGDRHPDTLRALGGVAVGHYHDGELGLARELLERLLQDDQATYGPDHPTTLITVVNLAATLSAAGDHESARALESRVLDVRRRDLGEQHPQTLLAAGSLGLTLLRLGQYEAARALQEQVLAGMRQQVGRDHPDTLLAMQNLAGTLSEMGDLRAARELDAEVLERRRAILGPWHPDTLAAMSNLAMITRNLGDSRAALELQRQAVDGLRSQLGERHPTTLAAVDNLAALHTDLFEMEAARAVAEEALAGRRDLYGDEHPDTIQSLARLAGIHYAMGGAEVARVLEERILQIERRMNGDEHPNTLLAMVNLAETLQELGDPRRAKDLLEPALEGFRSYFGDEHPDTLHVLAKLAAVLEHLDDWQGAERLLWQVVKGRWQALGEDHPDTLRAMRDLASLMRRHGEDLAAIRQLQERVLSGWRKHHGDLHLHTLRAMTQLAGTLYVQGELAAAGQLTEEAARGLSAVLGEDDPETRAAVENLAEVRRAAEAAGYDR